MLALVVALAACGGGDLGGPTLTDEETTTTDNTPEPPATTGRPAPSLPPKETLPTVVTTSTPGVTGEVPEGFVDKVVTDAASRAGVDESSVVVLTAAAMQWPDGSLGCPEPGVMYTQAIVDGSQIVVQAGGETYDYRLDGRGHFKLCESPTAKLTR
ncbi:MAG TPA: hypothetical protein VHM94_14085 [Acidimicrobiia bacterium]|nr:hypothetical protein [Acidimicrobiia bacterium]